MHCQGVEYFFPWARSGASVTPVELQIDGDREAMFDSVVAQMMVLLEARPDTGCINIGADQVSSGLQMNDHGTLAIHGQISDLAGQRAPGD